MNDEASKIPDKPNLSAMQPQLHIHCEAYGIEENAPIIKDIKAKAMAAGITYVACSSKVELPAKLFFDSKRDPYMSMLADKFDQQLGVVSSANVYRTAEGFMNAREAHSAAEKEVKTKLRTILQDSGIHDLLATLQKGEAEGQVRTPQMTNRDTHISLINVADRPTPPRTR